MTLCRCVRKPPPPARLWNVERAILPAARATHVVPNGCVCSINSMRTLSVVHIGLSGERTDVIARLKRDGTRAETRFGLLEKWTSPFKSAGVSVQSTAGSRGVRISGQTMDRPCSEAQCKSNGYPLQSPISPSLPLPRVTVCHHVLNGLCCMSMLIYE
jgi:hypothetical protein